MGVMAVTREMLAAKFESILPHLDERQRRLLMGAVVVRQPCSHGRRGGCLIQLYPELSTLVVSKSVSKTSSQRRTVRNAA